MFILNLLVLALAVTSTLACECGLPGSQRVYAGKESRPNAYPWMAHLRFTYPNKPGSFSQCGGSIIDEDTILTAGHCVHQENGRLHPAADVEVYLGAHNKFGYDKRLYSVRKIIADPKYSVKEGLDYDIALLKLDRKIVYNNKIAPICVPSEDTQNFKRLTVAGWGSIDAKGTSTQVLREVEVDYLKPARCMEYKETYYTALSRVYGRRLIPAPIHHNHMCALNERTRGDACAGDSGGPLMYKDNSGRYFVVGIVSGAWNDCSAPLTPGLYTMVKNYRSLITSNASGACLRKYA